jgi:hypothetical protein
VPGIYVTANVVYGFAREVTMFPLILLCMYLHTHAQANTHRIYFEYSVNNVNLLLLSFIRDKIMFPEAVSYFMWSMCACELWYSHSDADEDPSLLGYETMSVRK